MVDTQFNKNVVIFGAGSLGREILSWIESSKISTGLHIFGFYDLSQNALEKYGIDIPVLGNVNLNNLKEDQSFIIGITNSEFKEKLHAEAKEKGKYAANYIHESVLVGARTVYGEGLVMLPNSLLSCDVKLGNYVFINTGSQIGHDVIIGDYSSIMAGVDIGGGAQIGKNVFIGSKAVILPGVKIPDNTRIGAGSVVLRSIKQPGSYFGNPAKKIF